MINEKILEDAIMDPTPGSGPNFYLHHLVPNAEKMPGIEMQVKHIDYPPINYSCFDSVQNKIRFFINSHGFIDPYSTYLEFTVTNNNPNWLKIDGSPHSFIKTLTLSINGQIIEQITNYDIIHNFLYEITETEQHLNNIYNEGFNNEETMIPGLIYKSAVNKNSILNWDDDIIDNFKKENFSWHDSFNSEKINEKFTDSPMIIDADLAEGKTIFLNSLKSLFSTGRDFSGRETEIKLPENENINKFLMYDFPYPPKIINDGFIQYDKRPTCNQKRYKIPLMSLLIGFGVDVKQYKYIPMAYLPQLEVEIEINEHALIPIFNYNSIITEKKPINNPYAKAYFSCISRNKWNLSNVEIKTTQIFFPPSQYSTISNLLKDGFLINSTRYYFGPMKPIMETPENIYVMNYPFSSVRAVHCMFINTAYQGSDMPLISKYARFSKKICQAYVKYGNDLFPSKKLVGNSSNWGKKTDPQGDASEFFREYQIFNEQYRNWLSKYLVTPANYCLDISFTHILQYYINKSLKNDASLYTERDQFELMKYIKYFLSLGEIKKKDMFMTTATAMGTLDPLFSYLEYPQNGKFVLTINTQSVYGEPETYRCGISTQNNSPFSLEIAQHPLPSGIIGKADNDIKEAYWKSGYKDLQMVIVEYDYSIRVGPGGETIVKF